MAGQQVNRIPVVACPAATVRICILGSVDFIGCPEPSSSWSSAVTEAVSVPNNLCGPDFPVPPPPAEGINRNDEVCTSGV